MKKPNITPDCIKPIFENKFMNMADIQYAEGRHYFNASRHKKEDMVVLKGIEEFKEMLPDAVTIFTIIKTPGEEPRLLFVKEYRYPVGQFLVAPPAGLMDPGDRDTAEPRFTTAIREIKEETGIDVKESDRLILVNPLAFSSPGMTDESNALVCAVIELDDLSSLSQAGAEGGECFDGFIMLTKEQAKETLRKGTDDNGVFYSMYTWAALMYFVSGMWE